MAEKSSVNIGNRRSRGRYARDSEQMASKLVDRFALWSGVAGLVPVPVLDAVAVGGLQIQMVRRISQIMTSTFQRTAARL